MLGGGLAVLLLAAIALPVTAADLPARAAASADGSAVAAGAAGGATGFSATTRGTATRDATQAAGLNSQDLWLADRVYIDKSEREIQHSCSEVLSQVQVAELQERRKIYGGR